MSGGADKAGQGRRPKLGWDERQPRKPCARIGCTQTVGHGCPPNVIYCSERCWKASLPIPKTATRRTKGGSGR
jgi:hypothetical protein